MKKVLFVILFCINMVYAQKIYIAEGMSAPGQSPRAAFIAAKLDAQRQLLEQLGNIKIDSSTTVKDGMLENDTIRTTIKGLLKNAKVIQSKYDPVKKYAVVKMAINYNQVAANIIKHKKFKNIYVPHKEYKNVKQCDGLIIDVRNHAFEPAIINKIMYAGNIIYDPSKVPQSVIVQRGLAAYTVTVNKAKAILDSYGSRTPCIVKPKKIIKNTDVELNKKDAQMISAANEKNAFLEKARIVFVMDN